MSIDIVDRLRAPRGGIVADTQTLEAARDAANEIERLRAVLKNIYTENMHCAGDADSMAMCIVSTQGVARDAINTHNSEPKA